MLRWVTVSPVRHSVIYGALGKLWIKSLPNGVPERLTDDRVNGELYPSFSPDGNWIVYATWNDKDKCAIWKVRSDGAGRTKLTSRTGHYVEPDFSPDGKRIVFRRIGGDGLRGNTYDKDQGVYWMPSEGGKASLITEEG